MEKFLLPYAATGYFSKTVIDYLAGKESLKPFYDYPPDLSYIQRIIEKRAAYPTNREVLSESLNSQHEKFRSNDLLIPVIKNIDSLRNEKTFTITTAHQPNLFLGPLYLIYKIISAINLAKKLCGEYPAYHFVPVYWIGSEDHDKEELNHIHLFGKTITWNTDQLGAFGRMGTESLHGVIEEMKALLGDSDAARECMLLIEDCYLGEETVSSATTKILYRFFASDGLVIVDGDDREIKKLFIPVIEKELFDQFSSAVVKKSAELFSQNYSSQVMPRDINLFFLDGDIRQRIVKDKGKWQVLNTDLSFSEEALRAEVNAAPWKFSPNVVLRPLYQEMVLPGIAFIGGGSEVSYWLLLKSLFDAEQVPFPMILLRNSVLWIDSNQASKMDRLSISVEEIFQPAEMLIKKYLDRQSGALISLEEEKEKILAMMRLVLGKTSQMDPTLNGMVESEKMKMLKSLDSIADKLRKAAKKKEETAVQQIRGLKEKLFPEDELQERHDNFLSYYMKNGDRFFSSLKSSLDPLSLQFTVLSDHE